MLDTDNQGRPPLQDEKRIEFHKQRPRENPLGGDDPPPPDGTLVGGGPPPKRSSGVAGIAVRSSVVKEAVGKILDANDMNSGGVMSNVQDLADQLQWCVTTRRHLEGLQNELIQSARLYYQTIDELQGNQYLLQLLQRLLPLRDEFNRRAEVAYRHIDSDHVDYVNQQADSIANQLASIMNLPSNL